jgi:putative ABC transport system substrate-binding protein
MTSRRRFLAVAALGTLSPSIAAAQARPVKIGMLGPRSVAESTYAPGVVRRLAELGYRDGSTMVLEARSAGGVVDQYPKLARELIGLKCAVIFAIGNEAPARAIQAAGSPIPLIFLAIDYDPVERGLITSMRKPDRNSTGLHVQQNALVAKRLDIMREVMPAAKRVLVFADVFSRDQLPSARKAAETARIELDIIEFTKPPYDFAAAFSTSGKRRPHAFMALASPVFSSNSAVIAQHLIKERLPGIGVHKAHAEAGYLLSFGVDVNKVSRRVAEIGVRILKGAQPAEIPVEQADEFELAINAKTARVLGLKVPESVLARATRIVT